jgi:hypothetical protein
MKTLTLKYEDKHKLKMDRKKAEWVKKNGNLKISWETLVYGLVMSL